MVAHTPLVRRSADEQARMEQGLVEFFENSVPFHRLLGFKVESFTPDSSRVGLEIKPDIIGNPPHQRLHGGAIATILDAAGGFAICMGIAEKYCDEISEQLSARFARIGTIDLRVDYLRQGQGRRFVATAKVIRLGGRIASTQMTLEAENGELVATGAGSYVVS